MDDWKGMAERLRERLEPRMEGARKAAKHRAVVASEFPAELADQIEFGTVEIPLGLAVELADLLSRLDERLTVEGVARAMLRARGWLDPGIETLRQENRKGWIEAVDRSAAVIAYLTSKEDGSA